jgi:hypothetical protein
MKEVCSKYSGDPAERAPNRLREVRLNLTEDGQWGWVLKE